MEVEMIVLCTTRRDELSSDQHPLKGFSKKKDRRDRLRRLTELGILSSAHAEMLRRNEISAEWGEEFIENFVGYWPIPLGFVYIPVDGVDRAIMYANEETSVVAAANKAASIFRGLGASIETQIVGEHLTIGQILMILHPEKYEAFEKMLSCLSSQLISMANDGVASDMVARGGGVQGICIKNVYPDIDGSNLGVVVHVEVDTVDAMGANKVTTICEFISDILKKESGCEALLAILTNNVEKLVTARVELLNIDDNVVRRIEIASEFAVRNLDRAVTNNKGMLNALVAIAKATGNDDRALAISFSTYAMTSGQWPLSRWERTSNGLVGYFRAPIDVGTVGGAVMHPSAIICLEIMKTETAKDLRRVMAAAALAQNFAALLALTDKDKHFSRGHLTLQATNYARQVGAQGDEIKIVARMIRDNGELSAEGARKALKKISTK